MPFSPFTPSVRIRDHTAKMWLDPSPISLHVIKTRMPYDETPTVHTNRPHMDVVFGTGAVDKDGHEIFDGDIVEYIEKLDDHGDAQKLTGYVTFCQESACWCICGKESGIWNYMSDMTIQSIKVIGHMFENKELLK